MRDLRKIVLAHRFFKRCSHIFSDRRSCAFTDVPEKLRVNVNSMYKHATALRGVISVMTESMHTSSPANSKEIGYSELQKLQRKGLTVIDVRESGEIKATGTIPGSLHIPLKQVDHALGKTAADFKAKYGRKKPDEREAVVFLCQRGARSRKAMEKAVQRGYVKALSYRGGWEDYSKNAEK